MLAEAGLASEGYSLLGFAKKQDGFPKVCSESPLSLFLCLSAFRKSM